MVHKMKLTSSSKQQHKANSDIQLLKRKRNHDHNKEPTTINELPDDVLIAILSRLSPKEVSRTSVLSRRWRYLRFLSSSTLEFDMKDMFSPHHDRDMYVLYKDSIKPLRKKFVAHVDHVLKLHQHLNVDGLVIRMSRLNARPRYGRRRHRANYIDRWLSFASNKKVTRLELDLSSFHYNRTPYYDFPNMLSSRVRATLKFGFVSLRSLRLVGVGITDQVLKHLLASCPNLEDLCIRGSDLTDKPQFVDHVPNLKALELCDCRCICCVKISAMNLVSCTIKGDIIDVPFKEVPNLSELTLGGGLARSFIYEPIKHSSYSVQLVKLVLDIPDAVRRYGRDFRLEIDEYEIDEYRDLPRLDSLKHLELCVMSPVHQKLHLFTSLIKASPVLNEFCIKRVGFPDVDPASVSYECRHENLKVIKMSGFVPCSSDFKFVRRLLEIASSLETLIIDTESDYYKKNWWEKIPKPNECAEQLKLKLHIPPNTELLVT